MIDPFVTKGISFFRGKKVAVTGASGLIGSYAVKLLKESGAYVKAIINSRPPNTFTRMADEVRHFDLATPTGAHAAIAGCEAVFGGAGITGGVNLPKLDPVSYVGPASAMVINTLQACVEEKVPLFGYLSSTTVYPPAEHHVREDEADKPLPLYPLYRGIGLSKRFLERLCLYYQETTGLKISVARPAGAYGRFDNFDEKTSHVLPGMVERAIRTAAEGGKTFEVWGDGNDVRDFIHAQDVAAGLLMGMAVKADSAPINIASGTGITTAQLAETIIRAAGSPASLSFSTSKPSALRTRLVDISLAKDSLGWTPQISLADGVRDVIAWRKETK